MADTKISALTTKATPTNSDITNILDAAAANVDKKITLGSLPVSTAQQSAIDAKVEDTIVDGVTTKAPSQNAVFDALALKEDVANKATDFTTVNNTLYPSVKAVSDFMTAYTNATQVFIFSATNSDISGYESMPVINSYVSAAEASVATAITTSNTLLEEFASASGQPNVIALPTGLGYVSYSVERTSGSAAYHTFAQLYKRTTGGTETLLATSQVSEQLAGGRNQVNLPFLFNTISTLNSSDRLVIKVYAYSVSGTPTITLYWDGTTDARFSLPISATSSLTLQDTYNNSSEPEILTDSTRGALTIKRGSAADTDNIFEGKNGAGTITSYIRGDGSAQLDGSVFSTNTTAPNATVPVVVIAATNAATDVDVALVSKGNGAILAQVPDSTATGGNKRGNQAVDLQMLRATAAQVASGANSFATGARNASSGQYSVTAGFSNTSSGNSSVAMGSSNTSSATQSTAMGNSNTASGNYSVAMGNTCTASGTSSMATGANAVTGAILGRRTHSSGQIGSNGDSQGSTWDLKTSTTDATATLLTSGGIVAGSTSRVLLPNNTAFAFEGILVGKQTGSTNCAAWRIQGLIVRGTNAASTTIVGTPTITAIDNTVAWGTPTIAADTTNGCLSISVVGLAATNIRWTCTLRTTEITYV